MSGNCKLICRSVLVIFIFRIINFYGITHNVLGMDKPTAGSTQKSDMSLFVPLHMVFSFAQSGAQEI